MKIKLDEKLILRIFKELNKELKNRKVQGELYLVGGAVMCLNFKARPSTMDIDAYFVPKNVIYEAAKKVAQNLSIHSDWLNDAVKGFLSKKGEFAEYLDLSNLKVFCADPEYLLAMKCISMRLGKEFQDEGDVRFLIRYLNLKKVDEVIKIITKYYDNKLIPQKTFYALEEFF